MFVFFSCFYCMVGLSFAFCLFLVCVCLRKGLLVGLGATCAGYWAMGCLGMDGGVVTWIFWTSGQRGGAGGDAVRGGWVNGVYGWRVRGKELGPVVTGSSLEAVVRRGCVAVGGGGAGGSGGCHVDMRVIREHEWEGGRWVGLMLGVWLAWWAG
jgi:hypothetical protein